MTFRPVSRRPVALRTCTMAIVAALGLAGAVSAHAEDLMDVYRQALQQDPVLMQAEAQHRIGEAGVGISRAPLLPQLSGSATFNDSHGTQTSSQLIDTPSGPVFRGTTGSSSGRSRTNSVGLNQVLFDLGKFATWRASKASAAATAAQLESAEQDLILRVATAYFQVLTDEDQLRFAKANQKALAKQYDQAQAEFDVGLAAITDALSAKAAMAAAAATVIQDETVLFNDREALAQITGQVPKNLKILTANLPLKEPSPNNIEAWVQTALAHNPSLRAQRDQVEATQHDVTAARAARLPTLGASISYSRNPQWHGPGLVSSSTAPSGFVDALRADSRTTDTTIGLVLTVPLFAGGGIQAQIQQAIAQRDNANDVLVQDQRQIVATARNAFNSIQAGISQVDAQKEAVVSAQKALDATQAGFEVGTQTIVDVLLAQQTLFQAQSSYSQARHAYVINQLDLRFAAGTLSVNDLEAVNALLR